MENYFLKEPCVKNHRSIRHYLKKKGGGRLADLNVQIFNKLV